MRTVVSRAVFPFAFWLFVAAPAAAEDATDTAPASASSPWIVGDSAPRKGRIVEAWFDRRLPPTSDPGHQVTLGSPSDIDLWLRTESQSCRDAEPAARRATDASDMSLLYVCVRPRSTGRFRLIAATDAPALIVSGPIEAGQAQLVSPPIAAAITTIIAFLAGLLSAYVQGLIQLDRDDKRTRKAVEKTIADVLAREILANLEVLRAVSEGGDPVTLSTAAYNNTDALGEVAWGYLKAPAAAAYRAKVDAAYKTVLPRYQAAVKKWAAASSEQKATAREEAKREAAGALTAFHRLKG